MHNASPHARTRLKIDATAWQIWPALGMDYSVGAAARGHNVLRVRQKDGYHRFWGERFERIMRAKGMRLDDKVS